MFAWIRENLANILITLALAALVVRLILGMVRNKKHGNACGNCSGCNISCHLKPPESGQKPGESQGQ
jgi:hypothetical protein